MRLGIVGCSSKKLSSPAPARELYLGRIFKASLAYAEKTCDRVLIVSALYGLVEPDTVIEPYDARIVDQSEFDGKVSLQMWSAVSPSTLNWTTFVVLAGAAYARPFEQLWEMRFCYGCFTPLKGMSIGSRYSWLRAQLQEQDS